MKTSILIINKLAPVCLYHLKRLQCLHNCLFLLLRAPWLSSILRLWQIEILSQFNTTFPFYLSNIEIRNLHPVIMLRHILLYLLICGLALSRSDIPSHPYPVSLSHDVLPHEVWTINILSPHAMSCQ